MKSQAQIQAQKSKPQLDIDLTNDIIAERNREIEQIRKDMIDVNQLFKDTAELINQQGEVIDNIENNITSAKDDVEYGNNEIKKAEEYQDKANSLTAWIAGGIAGTVMVAGGIATAVLLL